MALINCPECGTQVSDKAEKCPKCAYPFQGKASNQNEGMKVSEVQLTKKKHKRRFIWAAIMASIGIIFILIGTGNSGEKASSSLIIGLILLVIAIIYSIIVRAIRWWEHD